MQLPATQCRASVLSSGSQNSGKKHSLNEKFRRRISDFGDIILATRVYVRRVVKRKLREKVSSGNPA